MYSGIAFHLAYQGPIGLTGVHLGTRAAMDCERLYATVLQLFSQISDNKTVIIPPQTRLHGDRSADSFHHVSRDVKQQRYVAKHARTGPLAGYFLYRTAEIQVNQVGFHLFNNLRSLNH